jgi:tRNA(fMet)-specific endonuclease VapC
MIILDTDHVSILQRQSAARESLLGKLNAAIDVPMTSAITLEEQSRSWIAEIGRLRDVSDQVNPYRRLVDLFEFFSEWDVVPFCTQSAEQFKDLRASRVRIASTDLKIASIAVVNDALLLTANSRDFEKVPGLRFENWLS